MIDTMNDIWFIGLLGFIAICIIGVIVFTLNKYCITKTTDICGCWVTLDEEMFHVYETDGCCYIQFTTSLKGKSSGIFLVYQKKRNRFYFIRDNIRHELVYCKKNKSLAVKQVVNCH